MCGYDMKKVKIFSLNYIFYVIEYLVKFNVSVYLSVAFPKRFLCFTFLKDMLIYL